jgi:hypothetical protein
MADMDSTMLTDDWLYFYHSGPKLYLSFSESFFQLL